MPLIGGGLCEPMDSIMRDGTERAAARLCSAELEHIGQLSGPVPGALGETALGICHRRLRSSMATARADVRRGAQAIAAAE